MRRRMLGNELPILDQRNFGPLRKSVTRTRSSIMQDSREIETEPRDILIPPLCILPVLTADRNAFPQLEDPEATDMSKSMSNFHP